MANPKQHGPRTFTLRGGRGMVPTNNLPSKPGHKIEGYQAGVELGRKVAMAEDLQAGLELGAKIAAVGPVKPLVQLGAGGAGSAWVASQAGDGTNPVKDALYQEAIARMRASGQPVDLRTIRQGVEAQYADVSKTMASDPVFAAGVQQALHEGVDPSQFISRASTLARDRGFSYQVRQQLLRNGSRGNEALQGADTALSLALPQYRRPLDLVMNGVAMGARPGVTPEEAAQAAHSEGWTPTANQELAQARGQAYEGTAPALARSTAGLTLGGLASAAGGAGVAQFNGALGAGIRPLLEGSKLLPQGWQDQLGAWGKALGESSRSLLGTGANASAAVKGALGNNLVGNTAAGVAGATVNAVNGAAEKLPEIAAAAPIAAPAAYGGYKLTQQVLNKTPTGEIPALNQAARGVGQAVQRIPGAGWVGEQAARAGQLATKIPLVGQPLARLGTAIAGAAPGVLGTALRRAGPLATVAGASADTVGTAMDSFSDEGNEEMARRGALARQAGPMGVGEAALRGGAAFLGNPGQFTHAVWDGALANGNVGRVGDALGLEKLKSMQERSNDISNDLVNGGGDGQEGSEFQNRFNQAREKYEASVPVTNFPSNEARKQYIDGIAARAAHRQGQQAWAAQRSVDQGGTGAYFSRTTPTQSPDGTPAGRLQGQLAQDLGGRPEQYQEEARNVYAPGHYQGDHPQALQAGEAMAYRAPAYGTNPTIGQLHQQALARAPQEVQLQPSLADTQHQPAPRPLALQRPTITQAVPPVTGGLFHPQAQLPAPQVAAKPALQLPAPTAFKLPGPAPIKS